MNDKDTEAFERWLEDMRFHGHRPEGYEYRAWQAACEWKQHEVDAYKEAARTEAEFVNELQEENKKLRECVKFYAYAENWDVINNEGRYKQEGESIYFISKDRTKPDIECDNGKCARQVLKELDDK